ncbi:MAG TPA: hypothetical protein PLH80_00070 [Spirochaetota bacterium]|nr:hypothetical protein [Spirochaetota bacterium]HOT19672.1 hypothetical protein [Spirochaetota bacterium]HPD05136.1 hypothetical protein [Spirochaetota bacterium]HQG43064.1 hypothetical protein [Spirochaetota bacterium]HQI36945.1 hypothetical protein [Spirochaetota bacterium]
MIKKTIQHYIGIIALVIGCCLVTGLSYEIAYTIIFTPDGLDLFNAKKVRLKNNTAGYTVATINYKESVNPLITDLLLSFDSDFPYLAKDDSGHYAIRYAQYKYLQDAIEGEGCAQFFHRDHRVDIQTAKNNWLTNCDDLGSFTIEASIKLLQYSSAAIVLSRTGFSQGKQGFEMLCVKNKLAVRFYKMFYKKDNTPIDVFLHRGPSLPLNAWQHISISFDRISGKLETWINGDVVETVYCTESGEPFVDVLVPKFNCHDLPIATVGKNFYGCIDKVRISQRYIENLQKETAIAMSHYKPVSYNNRDTINREGIITSPVYQFPDFGTMVLLFHWQEQLPPSTYVWMEFRISDEMFKSDDMLPQWYRINNNQKNIYLKKVGDSYCRGKYYQWRAHLISSPDGTNAPTIYAIELQYALDKAPQPPVMVAVDSVSDRVITLKWKKNVEYDILGYKIYYGVKSGKYDGVITTIGNKRITNELSDNNGYISVTLTNEIIEENRNNDAKGFLQYPVLKNNVIYYFAVTAYDSYKPDTLFNHESKPSNEVSARPEPGSDIQ